MIDDLWYKSGVIYCLSVGTYMDANGDGIGDFKGLLRRLDYLQGLGIITIWLMPFQPSPGKDDGYDISDTMALTRATARSAISSSSPMAASSVGSA
jgi:maltose alpha-D-glucosyltransferase / alpha-amylase